VNHVTVLISYLAPRRLCVVFRTYGSKDRVTVAHNSQDTGDIQHCTLPVRLSHLVFLLLLRRTEFWASVFT